MPPRALLIGSGYGGLPVDESVALVAAWLRSRAFAPDEILTLTEQQATRDEILGALATLAAHAQHDHPTVVYYAGHGYLYRTGGDADGFDHTTTPLIVPIGLRRTAAGIQFGVLGSELTAALQHIAARTNNLTVILDCCHADALLHLGVEQPPAPTLAPTTTTPATDNLAAELGPTTTIITAPRPTASPFPFAVPPHPTTHAVVLTASSAGGRAYVHPLTNRLIFTDALLAALAHAPTWDAALAEARGVVQATFPAQQPGLFGPRFRRPLTLDEHLPDGELFHVELTADDALILRSGAARDLHEGDEFDLLPLATTTYGPADILATARPTELRPDRCRLVPDPDTEPPRRNCYARRNRRGLAPAVDLDALDDPDLRRTIADLLPDLHLHPADTTPRPLAGRLERRGEQLHVHDHGGHLVHTDTLDALDLEALHHALYRLDRWLALSRWLRADSSARPLRRYYGLEWSPRHPQPTTTPLRLHPGDHLTVTLHNLDRGEADLYVQALRVRPDRSVSAWDAFAESVAARQRLDLDLPLDDPDDGLPPGDYHEWTFVAVANHEFAIADLVTPGHMLTPHDFLTGRHLIRGGKKALDAERQAIELLAFPYLLAR